MNNFILSATLELKDKMTAGLKKPNMLYLVLLKNL